MKNSLINLSKKVYLSLVNYKSRKVTKVHDKIVCLVSFPSTSSYILEKLFEKFENRFIICYTENAKELAKSYGKRGCTTIYLDNFFTLLRKGIPTIKGSKFVLCDNYFAFLAGIDFLKATKIVQLWHANGAIKTFGLEAEYAKNASVGDKRRYHEVYQRFTHYLVSSDKMASIFEKNYQQQIKKLPFGYPLTDLYFDEKWLAQSKKKFAEKFSSSKKSLLYVPTYREEEQINPINFATLQRSLGEEWQIFAKAHPHDENLKKRLAEDAMIITDFKGMTLNELCPNIDCLVTDYSSVPFEYTLAKQTGKIVFFCYDIKEYKKSVGIENDFEKWAPGKIVTTEEELIEAIQKANEQNFEAFNRLWNEYAKGNSAEQLIEWMDKE